MTKHRRHAALLAGLILVAQATAPFPSAATADPCGDSDPERPPLHLPIVIDGNDDLTAANGVTGGTGTAGDPFVIGPWDMHGHLSGPAILIENTNAHVTIRHVDVRSEFELASGLGSVRLDTGPGILARNTQNLTIDGVEISGSGGQDILGALILMGEIDATVRCSDLDTQYWEGSLIFGSISGSSRLVIDRNRLRNATDGDGITLLHALEDGARVQVSNNVLELLDEQGVDVRGTVASGRAEIFLQGNTVSSDGEGLRLRSHFLNGARGKLEVADNTVDPGPGPAVEIDAELGGPVAVDVRRNNVRGSMDGPGVDLALSFAGEGSVDVSGNTIVQSRGGIVLVGALADGGRGAISNNRLTDNTPDGLAVSMAVPDGSSFAISGNDISGSPVGIRLPPALGGPASVTGNVIYDNAFGILFSNGPGTAPAVVTANDLFANAWGIRNDGPFVVAAELNWWGAASGPGGSGPGEGDPVGEGVDYAPWSTTPWN